MPSQENGAECGWGPLGDFSQVGHRRRDACVPVLNTESSTMGMEREEGEGEGRGGGGGGRKAETTPFISEVVDTSIRLPLFKRPE